MKAAIYSRKSKYTGKGESIENQIQLCSNYALLNLNISKENLLIYEDEGFSGGNLDRPGFTEMLKNAENKHFDYVICYRLDRISRSISDFSYLIEKLQQHNIGFISIREQFDTSTPMGRAMMYITSVFAQLERETIAQRIRDNMMGLAKSGRWLGGTTPTGFKSEPVIYLDDKLNQRKMYTLTPIENELQTIRILFNRYMELKSLGKLEAYCRENNIRTKNQNNFQKATLRLILKNPVYAIADKELYDYFYERDVEIANPLEDFDGIHGILPYNRTERQVGKKIKHRNENEWIIAVAAHNGIIKSSLWIKVQNILESNKHKKIGYGNYGILSGILKCSSCGSYMRSRPGRISRKDGIQIFYYKCTLKESTSSTSCKAENIRGDALDKKLIDILSNLNSDGGMLLNHLEKYRRSTAPRIIDEKHTLENKITDNLKSIDTLLHKLSQNNTREMPVYEYILEKISSLHSENETLRKKLEKLNAYTNITSKDDPKIKSLCSSLLNFQETLSTLGIKEKKSILQRLISQANWDGTQLIIYLE